MEESLEGGRDAVDGDLSSFLAKVDEIGLLIFD